MASHRARARRSIPAEERAVEKRDETKSEKATDPASSVKVDAAVSEAVEKAARRWVPIANKKEEKRLLTGVVLLPPPFVDAHGDSIPDAVIEKAAHKFLADYNKSTTMGLMHKDFTPPLDLVESWISPVAFTLGPTEIPVGAWIITVRVNDAKIWKKVKNGELTGFSIGGKAKVKNLQVNNSPLVSPAA